MSKKELSVFSLAAEVELDSGVLMLRSKASEMFQLSLGRNGRPLSGDVMVCNFRDIIDCSSSFVDEFVLNWQRELCRTENTLMVLTEMVPDVRYSVISALNLQNRMDKEGLVLVAKEKDMLFHILGDRLESNVQDVFDLMANGNRITARLVADRFNLELNSAGNRLKKLYDAHATLRSEQRQENGGKYEYFLPEI